MGLRYSLPAMTESSIDISAPLTIVPRKRRPIVFGIILIVLAIILFAWARNLIFLMLVGSWLLLGAAGQFMWAIPALTYLRLDSEGFTASHRGWKSRWRWNEVRGFKPVDQILREIVIIERAQPSGGIFMALYDLLPHPGNAVFVAANQSAIETADLLASWREASLAQALTENDEQ